MLTQQHLRTSFGGGRVPPCSVRLQRCSSQTGRSRKGCLAISCQHHKEESSDHSSSNSSLFNRRQFLLVSLLGTTQLIGQLKGASAEPAVDTSAANNPSQPSSLDNIPPLPTDAISPSNPSGSLSPAPSADSTATQGSSPSSDAPSSTQPAGEATPSSKTTAKPKDSVTLSDQAAQQLLTEEEARRKLRKRGKGRLRELEEIRVELAEKELALLAKQTELLEKDQTVQVLKEELELERKLRALLTKEKDRAEEEAALAMGLCTGGIMLP